MRSEIILRGAAPSIERFVEVPEARSFRDLHVAIQDATGWRAGMRRPMVLMRHAVKQ